MDRLVIEEGHAGRFVGSTVRSTALRRLKLVGSSEPSTEESARDAGRVHDPLRALACRASEGDALAIRELVMALGGPMLRTIRKVIGYRHPDAEDVAQESIMGLLSSLENFRGDCTVSHFAHQVALRRALHARRHFKSRERLGDQELAPEGPADPKEESPLNITLSRERRRVVYALLDDLSEPRAEALALHFILGHSVNEIALMLEISPDTIWSRLKLGKNSLTKSLAEDERLRELLRGRSS